MTWQPELDDLRRRRDLAERMGGPDKVLRQHEAGRLTVRERLAALLDDGSFDEIGTLAGAAVYDSAGELADFTLANFVTGTGRINGRKVVVGADDFTIRGGAADAAIAGKQVYAEQLANQMRLPLVRLVEGTGGGGSVKMLEQRRGGEEWGGGGGRGGRGGGEGGRGGRGGRGGGRRAGGFVGSVGGRGGGGGRRHPGVGGPGGRPVEGAEAVTRLADLCSTFHLPVVTFTDQPGLLIGTRAEQRATIRHGVRAISAVYQSTVPGAEVIVRRVFGVGGAGMTYRHRLIRRGPGRQPTRARCRSKAGPRPPTGLNWNAAEDPAATLASIPARLDAVRNPLRTAERFGIEEIIDPRETRPLLCDWIHDAYAAAAGQPGQALVRHPALTTP